MRHTVLTIGAALMLLGAAQTQASAEPAERVWFAGVFRGTEDIALGQDSSNPAIILMVGREPSEIESKSIRFRYWF